jgi:hypothetical protein
MLHFPFFNPRLALARYPVSLLRRIRNELPELPIPQAPALLERWENELKWVIPRCPLCRKRHVHAAGLVGEDPRKLLTHKVKHCANLDGPSGYILIDADPQRTLRMAPEAR